MSEDDVVYDIGSVSSSSGVDLDDSEDHESLRTAQTAAAHPAEIMLETKVLKPKDPAILDSNEWPEFSLERVTIYQADPLNLVSLLDADTHNAVTVCGFLAAVDEDLEDQVLSLEEEGSYVVIEHVTQFAHGANPDGTYTLWAAGRAGWFDIDPAEEYQGVFADMMQAMSLLYSLEDIYSKARQQGRHITTIDAEHVFAEYAAANDACNDAAEAASMFYHHRRFLIASMTNDQHHSLWSKTPFYEHMQSRFPDGFKYRPSTDGREEPDLQDGMSEDSTGTNEATTGYKAKYHQIFRHLEKVRHARRLALEQMTIEGFGVTLYRDFDIDSEELGAEILRAYRAGLVRLMERTSTERADFDWTRRAIYVELDELGMLDSGSLSYLQIPLRPRTRPLPTSTAKTSHLVKTESSSDVPLVDVQAGPGTEPGSRHSQRARKGLLRLRARVSQKAAARQGLQIATESKTETSDDSSDESEAPALPLKRKGTAMDVDSEAKRHAGDWELKGRSTDASGLITTLMEEPLQDTQGQGPADVWTCPRGRCQRQVWEASLPANQIKIRQHLAEHHSVLREKLEIVQQESKYGPPVSNLIDRIRESTARTRSQV